MKERRRQHPQRGENHDDLRDDRDAPAIVLIDDMSRGERKRYDGDDLCEPDPPERELGIRAVVEFPPDGDSLHLIAEGGSEDAGEVESKIA